MQVGYMSGDVSGTFGSNQAAKSVLNLQPGQCVACVYDGHWWIGNIIEISTDNHDVKISFMHPHGPAASFCWGSFDECWVPMTYILCQLPALSMAGSTARQYTVDSVGLDLISVSWNVFNRKA